MSILHESHSGIASYADALRLSSRVSPPRGEANSGIARIKDQPGATFGGPKCTRVGKKRGKLCYLSKSPQDPSLFAFAYVGMARSPLVSSTCRGLRRPLHEGRCSC